MKHIATYSKRCLGLTPIRPQREVWGYSVKCSCGWSLQTNEAKPYVVGRFKGHKAECNLVPVPATSEETVKVPNTTPSCAVGGCDEGRNDDFKGVER